MKRYICLIIPVYSLVLLGITVLASCSGGKQETRFQHIEEIMTEDPERAYMMLDSIDEESLSRSEARHRDLLITKAADKAYFKHESDSVILRAVEYYSAHPEGTLYSEALYYAGRVNSDKGDYPKALGYYHDALENFPTNADNKDLLANILSQTGRLLNSLRLYKEAISYVKRSLQVNKSLNRISKCVYDIQLLGGIYMRSKNYAEAEKYFRMAIRLGNNVSESTNAKSMMYLAAIKYYTGQLDSALLLIRNSMDKVSPVVRNNALAYASEIYHAAGKTDSAYLFAKELIGQESPLNKETGYLVLLSPETKCYSDDSTINRYVAEYTELLEQSLDKNSDHQSIIQKSYYNYEDHEKGRVKAEERQKRLGIYLLISLIAVAVFVLFIFWQKYRNHKNLLKIQLLLDKLNTLNQLIQRKENNPATKECTDCEEIECRNDEKENKIEIEENKDQLRSKNDLKELKEVLKTELLNLYEKSENETTPDMSAIDPDAYLILMDYIEKDKILLEDDGLWERLEESVLVTYPSFKKNLLILTDGRSTRLDLQTCILIKFGITTTQMMKLLGRSKGAIISRRQYLGKKIFGMDTGIKLVDGVIKLI